jgi:DNA modification methylase
MMKYVNQQGAFVFVPLGENPVQSLEMKARGLGKNGANGHHPVPDRRRPPFTLANGRSGIIVGDARSILRDIPDETFRACITSPPYWGLRDYGVAEQIGAEMQLDRYIEHLVAVFREVRRVLRPDGTLWLNIGDAYTSGNRTWRDSDKKNPAREMAYRPPTPLGLKPKDLIGIPWKIAFALQADGWFLRSDIVWDKPNCQPESVRDRPTRSHEYVFLLTKSEEYFYDWQAVQEPSLTNGGTRRKRTVWQVNTEAFAEAHFATFPSKLVEPMVQAGTEPGDFVLDPFFGSGTVGEVSQRLGRNFIGVELKAEYADIALKRLGWRGTPNESDSLVLGPESRPSDIHVLPAPIAPGPLSRKGASGGHRSSRS